MMGVHKAAATIIIQQYVSGVRFILLRAEKVKGKIAFQVPSLLTENETSRRVEENEFSRKGKSRADPSLRPHISLRHSIYCATCFCRFVAFNRFHNTMCVDSS